MRIAAWVDSAEDLMKRLDGSPAVSGLVPEGFDRYLRIFSPVGVLSSERPGALELRVSWSLVCEQLGVELRPNTLWQRDIVSADPRAADLQEPGLGSYDTEVFERVGEVLQRHEVEDRSWYFASWAGYGVEEGDQPVWFPMYHHDALEMSVFERWNEAAAPFEMPLVPSRAGSSAPLAAFGQVSSPAKLTPPPQLPMYWWPEGCDWALGTALYGRSVYLACSSAIADDVLTAPGIEAIEVSPTDEAEHEE